MRTGEYGPDSFWWERMRRCPESTVVPGQAPEEPLVAHGPLPVPHDAEVKAMILCMLHRRRASECGCVIGEGA